VFAAKFAVFFLLDLFLLLFLVPRRVVIATFAFRALEYDDVSHPILASFGIRFS
jgi:hypothetical protein